MSLETLPDDCLAQILWLAVDGAWAMGTAQPLLAPRWLRRHAGFATFTGYSDRPLTYGDSSHFHERTYRRAVQWPDTFRYHYESHRDIRVIEDARELALAPLHALMGTSHAMRARLWTYWRGIYHQFDACLRWEEAARLLHRALNRDDDAKEGQYALAPRWYYLAVRLMPVLLRTMTPAWRPAQHQRVRPATGIRKPSRFQRRRHAWYARWPACRLARDDHPDLQVPLAPGERLYRLYRPATISESQRLPSPTLVRRLIEEWDERQATRRAALRALREARHRHDQTV